MSDELRDLLNRVASGEISPEEAEILMQARASKIGAPTTETTVEQPAPEPVRRISVRGSAVRLVIVADPTVDTAIAEGPHRVSHVGDRLTVHSDLRVGEYEAEAPKSTFATWLSNVNRAGSTLRVRVNPDLPLDVLNVAGSLELSGMRGHDLGRRRGGLGQAARRRRPADPVGGQWQRGRGVAVPGRVLGEHRPRARPG